MTPRLYIALADTVLSIHVAFVVFVILGLVLIIIGGLLRWTWVRNLWFRLVHLVGIGIVVAQAWAGMVCPLTILEMWLRNQGSAPAHEGSSIQFWLQRILYYEAPEWVFVTAYSLFGFLVVLCCILVPPRRKNARRSVSHSKFAS